MLWSADPTILEECPARFHPPLLYLLVSPVGGELDAWVAVAGLSRHVTAGQRSVVRVAARTCCVGVRSLFEPLPQTVTTCRTNRCSCWG
jgi:hypothetical protein